MVGRNETPHVSHLVSLFCSNDINDAMNVNHPILSYEAKISDLSPLKCKKNAQQQQDPVLRMEPSFYHL